MDTNTFLVKLMFLPTTKAFSGGAQLGCKYIDISKFHRIEMTEMR